MRVLFRFCRVTNAAALSGLAARAKAGTSLAETKQTNCFRKTSPYDNLLVHVYAQPIAIALACSVEENPPRF